MVLVKPTNIRIELGRRDASEDLRMTDAGFLAHKTKQTR